MKKLISDKRKYGAIDTLNVAAAIDRSNSVNELADIVSFFRNTDEDEAVKSMLADIDKIAKPISSFDPLVAIEKAKDIAYSQEFDKVLVQVLNDLVKDDKRLKHYSKEDLEELIKSNLTTYQKRYRKWVRGLTDMPKRGAVDPLIYEALFGGSDDELKIAGGEIEAIVKGLIDNSQFTEAEAKAKFDSVDFKTTAKNSIKRADNYDIKSFEKDCIDVFRLANGHIQLDKVHHLARVKRASVIDGLEVVMETGTYFKRSIAWHELGHLIEFRNPNILKKSIELLKKRLELSKTTGKNGGGLRKLSSLTGNRAYKRNEVAIDDGFISYYAGKVYQRTGSNLDNLDATEIISTGLEMLSDPLSSANLLRKDPEHFKLVMTALKGLHK